MRKMETIFLNLYLDKINYMVIINCFCTPLLHFGACWFGKISTFWCYSSKKDSGRNRFICLNSQLIRALTWHSMDLMNPRTSNSCSIGEVTSKSMLCLWLNGVAYWLNGICLVSGKFRITNIPNRCC